MIEEIFKQINLLPGKLAQPPDKNMELANTNCSSSVNIFNTKAMVSARPASELPIILG